MAVVPASPRAVSIFSFLLPADWKVDVHALSRAASDLMSELGDRVLVRLSNKIKIA